MQATGGSSGGSMSKVRVYEVAKQLNLDPKAVVGLFQAIGINEVRNHMSSVEPEAVERVKRHLEKQKTHDVVEERVRTDGRVVKRRAVAKSSVDAPSSPMMPAAAPSMPTFEPSEPRIRAAHSAPTLDHNGTRGDVIARERESPGRIPV